MASNSNGGTKVNWKEKVKIEFERIHGQQQSAAIGHWRQNRYKYFPLNFQHIFVTVKFHLKLGLNRN